LVFPTFNTDVENSRLAHYSLLFSLFVSAVLWSRRFNVFYLCEMFLNVFKTQRICVI
jgi:hypothetical protein